MEESNSTAALKYPPLNKVREKGGKYLFVTNNSSKGVNAYVEKLTKMGIVADEDNFLTSTDATILYLNNNYKESMNKNSYILK